MHPIDALTSVHTGRLDLRVPDERDVEAWWSWHQDPLTVSGLALPGPLSRDDAWRALALMVGHWHLRGYGMWTIVERATGRAVGRGGLFFPHGWPELEVGWLLAPEARGQGYALEMARAALALASTVLGVRRVCHVILPTNRPSIAVAERLGARPEGTYLVRGTVATTTYVTDCPPP